MKKGEWFQSRPKIKTKVIKINTCKNCGQMCNGDEIFCTPKCRRFYRKAKTALDKIKKGRG